MPAIQKHWTYTLGHNIVGRLHINKERERAKEGHAHQTTHFARKLNIFSHLTFDFISILFNDEMQNPIILRKFILCFFSLPHRSNVVNFFSVNFVFYLTRCSVSIFWFLFFFFFCFFLFLVIILPPSDLLMITGETERERKKRQLTIVSNEFGLFDRMDWLVIWSFGRPVVAISDHIWIEKQKNKKQKSLSLHLQKLYNMSGVICFQFHRDDGFSYGAFSIWLWSLWLVSSRSFLVVLTTDLIWFQFIFLVRSSALFCTVIIAVHRRYLISRLWCMTFV